jgi:hypothetical protein
MANVTKPDLNKLRTEIDTRKREKGIIGETAQGTPMVAKDVFLNTLLSSLATGQNTPVVNNIRTMNERADIVSGAIKTGVVTPEAVNKIKELKNSSVAAPIYSSPTMPRNPAVPQRINEVDMSPERDDAIFADLERKRRTVTLAESIEGFGRGNATVNPQQLYNAQGQPVHPDGSLINPPAISYGNNGMPMINESYLNENVKKVATNYLIENLGPIMEESIKSTILELYAVDRIKEVLQENKEMIKSIVYETIRELQKKNKDKGQ